MRDITSEYLGWLAELHRRSFPKGWNVEQFTQLLAGGARGWLIEDKGFILVRSAADEAEIITLATEPEQRRQGIAEQLLRHTVEQLKTEGITLLFLEVRENNEAAIGLYRKHHFTQTATRPAYYGMPDGTRKDALVMQLPLV